LRWTQIEAPHNYNKQSREAVYGFFNQWLRHENKPVTEQPYHSETDAELRVYPDGKAAPGTLNEKQLIDSLIEERQQQWQKSLPRNAREQVAFRKTFGAALRQSLGIEMPQATAILSPDNSASKAASNEAQEQTVIFGRVGRGDRIEAQLYGKPDKKRAVTLIVSEQIPTALITGLLNSGRVILHLRPFRFQTPRDVRANFFTTYNRTELGNRVQDILTAVAYLEQHGHRKIELIGVGRAGLSALLARAFAPNITRAVCDVDGLDTALDDSFVNDLAQSGLRRAGDFRTAGVLAAPSNLWLHNTQDRFDAAPIAAAYRAMDSAARFKVSTQRAAETAIVEWLEK
jgi:hypothetical protein